MFAGVSKYSPSIDTQKMKFKELVSKETVVLRWLASETLS